MSLMGIHRTAGDTARDTRAAARGAATALYALVTRLYQYGQNVFADQPAHARNYTSTYARVRKAVYRAKQTRAKKKAAKGGGE